jgi:predicted nucleic acid-binding protein
VLGREKFRRYVDPDTAPLRCADPDDDYLIALAHDRGAVLVSGDGHLLELAGRGAPILSPADVLAG